MTNTERELLPCPFCGGQPTANERVNGYGYGYGYGSGDGS